MNNFELNDANAKSARNFGVSVYPNPYNLGLPAFTINNVKTDQIESIIVGFRFNKGDQPPQPVIFPFFMSNKSKKLATSVFNIEEVWSSYKWPNFFPRLMKSKGVKPFSQAEMFSR